MYLQNVEKKEGEKWRYVGDGYMNVHIWPTKKEKI